jgi:hypothetical protein
LTLIADSLGWLDGDREGFRYELVIKLALVRSLYEPRGSLKSIGPRKVTRLL